MQWLERFRFELTVIPQRDPFQSAVENIEKYAGDTQYEFSRYQRDLAIVTEYEQEYEQVANVFKMFKHYTNFYKPFHKMIIFRMKLWKALQKRLFLSTNVTRIP